MIEQRVAIVIPSLSHGGAERVASVLAAQWSLLPGVEVHVITFTQLSQFYLLPPSVKQFNVAIENNPGATALVGLAFSIRKYITDNKIDAVLSMMDKYNVFMSFCMLGSKVRLTVSDRSNPKKKKPVLLRFLKRLTYPRAHGVIAQTTLAKFEVRRQTGASRVRVIPNPVSLSDLCCDLVREKIILNVGRLVPEKGQEHLIRSFALASLPDWRLVILGEGPRRERLQALAAELGVADQLELVGTVTEVAHWYARSSIFAFSSVSEGFPNALVEAMSSGLPCVSFDCEAGPSDIIEHGINGYLVSVRDEVQFASYLTGLASNECLRRRLGGAARERALAFDQRKISICYFDFCTNSDSVRKRATSCELF